MYKEFIRKYLLENGYGVYPKLLEVYREQIGIWNTPSRFRRWLAEELDVPVEKINLNSLNAAWRKEREKKNLQISNNKNDIPGKKENGFAFSKPNSEDKKPSRISES